jgi:hypothetical protein
MALNVWMSVNDELERIWKEVVVAKFKLQSRYLSGETEECPENISQNIQCPGRESNSVSTEYESGTLKSNY